MKRTDQDRLLKDLFVGEESSDFRKTSLERALTSMRRRRQTQRGISICALAGLLIALVWSVNLNSRKQALPPQIVATSLPVPANSRPEADRVKVKFITDDELLALFPDRPVALIGKPGHQRLVFIDQPADDKM